MFLVLHEQTLSASGKGIFPCDGYASLLHHTQKVCILIGVLIQEAIGRLSRINSREYTYLTCPSEHEEVFAIARHWT